MTYRMIAAHGAVIIGIMTGSVIIEIIKLCGRKSGCSVRSDGHCQLHGRDWKSASKRVGGLIMCTQNKLHVLKMGVNLEEFSRNWIRIRGNGLHMVGAVVPCKPGSCSVPPIRFPHLEM